MTRTSVSPVRNVLANWTAYFVSAVIGFALSPYVVHRLGDSSYGVWVLLGSVVGYLGLLDLGVRGAVTRFVAKLHAGNHHEEAGRIASAGLSLFGILGALAIAISVGLAFSVGHLFKIPDAMVPSARIVVLLSGLNIAIALVTGVFGGIITARQRFDVSSSLEVGIEILRAAAVVLVLRLGKGLVALALVQLCASSIRGAAFYVISRRIYPELLFATRSWARGHMREVFSFSAYSTLLNFSSRVILELDAVVIGAFLPVHMITFFGIAANLTQSARSLIAGISQTITPRVSAMVGRGAANQTAQMTLKSGRTATLIILPIALTFMVRGSTFIGVWMGPSYAQLSGRVLFVLSMMLAVVGGRQIIVATLMGLNEHKRVAPVLIAEAAFNLGLSLALVKPMGVVGVAWGTTIPGLISSLVFVPAVLRRLHGIPLREIWWEMWIRPALAMAPFTVALLLVERFWVTTSVIGFFLQIAAVLPVALAGALWLGLSSEERQAIFARIPLRASSAQRV